MKSLKNNRGTNLIELLIAMAIFGILIGVVLSLYSTMLKYAASSRKIAKTQSDTTNVVWPLFKEIESAGFGVPASNSGSACSPAVNFAASVLTVHSTASGDQTGTGSWSYIGANCLTSLTNGQSVAIINPADKSYISSLATVGAGGNLSGCQSSWQGNIAYWIPTGGALSCYETNYTLSAYTTGTNAAPAICAQGTSKLARSVSTNAGSTNYQPMLDCVLAADYRFGCIDTNGNVIWQSGTTCSNLNSNGNYNPRLIRIGLVFQESTRNDGQGSSSTITLFGDTQSPNTITLTSNQRYYKWRAIERTIALRNLE